jgi:Polyketide cyclase / dehydrase and lipid transport
VTPRHKKTSEDRRMKPIRVSTEVDRPREEVYAFLDVLANHAPFTDHMLTGWSFSGPASGVGAKARVRSRTPGPENWADMEVIAAEPPRRTVEQTVGAGGRRRMQGTYTLEALPGDRTLVTFELAFLELPRAERLAAPLLRAWLQRANAKAMRRLAATLAASGEPVSAAR